MRYRLNFQTNSCLMIILEPKTTSALYVLGILNDTITPISKAILQTSINNFLDFHNTFMMEIKSILSSICLSVFILFYVICQLYTYVLTFIYLLILAIVATMAAMLMTYLCFQLSTPLVLLEKLMPSLTTVRLSIAKGAAYFLTSICCRASSALPSNLHSMM